MLDTVVKRCIMRHRYDVEELAVVTVELAGDLRGRREKGVLHPFATFTMGRITEHWENGMK